MKKHLKKIIAIGFIFILGSHGVFAQKKQPSAQKKRLEVFAKKKQHELMLYGGGGLSTLKYDVSIGKQKNGFGGQVGFGYNYSFIPQLSLRTGIEFSFHNAAFTLDNTNLIYNTIDIENTPFEFRCKMDNYREKQNLILFQIPLMLQFQVGTIHQFYAAVGGKLGIPLSAKYNSSETTIYNSGYYAEEDYEYTTQRFMGFGRFSGNEGKLNFKTTTFIASVEAGAKWLMGDGYRFYTGVFLDYGLNNMLNQSPTPPLFLNYNASQPSDFTVNSILESQYTQNDDLKRFANKVIPVSAGVKLVLGF